MSVLVSGLNKKSEDFRENENRMQEVGADLRSHVDRITEGGGEVAQKRHLERGKLLPRERIDILVDGGSPFLEISQLAAQNMYEGAAPSAGLLTVIG